MNQSVNDGGVRNALGEGGRDSQEQLRMEGERKQEAWSICFPRSTQQADTTTRLLQVLAFRRFHGSKPLWLLVLLLVLPRPSAGRLRIQSRFQRAQKTFTSRMTNATDTSCRTASTPV